MYLFLDPILGYMCLSLETYALPPTPPPPPPVPHLPLYPSLPPPPCPFVVWYPPTPYPYPPLHIPSPRGRYRFICQTELFFFTHLTIT